MIDFITLEIEGLSNSPHVISVSGCASVSNDYEFKVLIKTIENQPLDIEECLNQVIQLSFNGQDGAQYQTGIVKSIQQVFSSRPREQQYTLICGSPLEALKLVAHSNVFIDYTPIDIINEVLSNYTHLDFHISCSDTLPNKSFTQQYKETDYHFIGRLCEHWGIHYYFDTEQNNTLIFADDKHYQESETDIRFIEAPTPEQLPTAVTALNMQQHPSIDHVVIEGRNPEQDSQLITAEYGTPSPNQASLTFKGIGIDNEDEASLIAQRRHELQTSQHTIYTGTATAQTIQPGFVTRIKIDDQNTIALLVLSTEYSAVNLNRVSDEKATEFHLQFTAMPADITFRPQLSRTIPTAISSTARVHSVFDSPSMAHRDALGRYKVIFDYMETERISHWIRKSQSAAKDNHLDVPLLPGTEVQIAYLGGNPDLPYISCALENSQSTEITSNNERPYTTSLHTSGILSLQAGRSLSASFRAPMNKSNSTNPATVANTVTPSNTTATISEYNRLNNHGVAMPNNERLTDTHTDYNVESYQGQVYKVQDTVSFFLGDNPSYYFGQQYREAHIKNPHEKSATPSNTFSFSDDHFLEEDLPFIDHSSALSKDRQVGMVRKLFGNRYNYHDGHIVTVRESSNGPHKTINYGPRYIEHIQEKTDKAVNPITLNFPDDPALKPTQDDFIIRNHLKQFRMYHNDTVTIQTGNTYIERTGDTERVQKEGASKVTISGTSREKSINISGISKKEITAAKIEAHFTTPELLKSIAGDRKTHIYGSDNALISGAKTALTVGANVSTEVGGSAKIVAGIDTKLVLGMKSEMIMGPSIKWNKLPECKKGPGHVTKEDFSVRNLETELLNLKISLSNAKLNLWKGILILG